MCGISKIVSIWPVADRPIYIVCVLTCQKSRGGDSFMRLIFQTFEETERRHWECMENEWEREKQKILNTLLGSGQDTIDFQPDTEVLLLQVL